MWRGNLLEYPVTVVGVLGLWSFIAGGTLRGAGHGHGQTPTRTHTHTRVGGRGGKLRGRKQRVRKRKMGVAGRKTRWRWQTKVKKTVSKKKQTTNIADDLREILNTMMRQVGHNKKQRQTISTVYILTMPEKSQLNVSQWQHRLGQL